MRLAETWRPGDHPLTLDRNEEHFRIPSGVEELRLFLRYLAAARAPKRAPVLYVHGGDLPVGPLDRASLRWALLADELARCRVSRLGARLPRLRRLQTAIPRWRSQPSVTPRSVAPKSRASRSSGLCASSATIMACARISIIAHSWGTIAAGRFAGRCPSWSSGWSSSDRSRGARRRQSLRALPPGASSRSRINGTASPRKFQRASRRFSRSATSRNGDHLYLDTDPESRTRSPASVKTPSGPLQDIADAWAGDLAYDPGLIRAPVAIIRGEWDSLATDADARGSSMR